MMTVQAADRNGTAEKPSWVTFFITVSVHAARVGVRLRIIYMDGVFARKQHRKPCGRQSGHGRRTLGTHCVCVKQK